ADRAAVVGVRLSHVERVVVADRARDVVAERTIQLSHGRRCGIRKRALLEGVDRDITAKHLCHSYKPFGIEYVLRSSISGVVVCTTASMLCGLGNSHRLNLKRLLRLSLRGGLLSRRSEEHTSELQSRENL